MIFVIQVQNLTTRKGHRQVKWDESERSIRESKTQVPTNEISQLSVGLLRDAPRSTDHAPLVGLYRGEVLV